MKSNSPVFTYTLVAICCLLHLGGVHRLLLAQSFRNPLRIVTSQDPSSINVADLNGDGHPDLLYGISTGIVQTATGSVHALLWQRNGVYVAGPVLQLPPDTNTLCRTGDLNGDGLPDLLCPSVSPPPTYKTSLVFFAGRGDGSFGSPVYSSVIQTGGNYSLIYPLISTFADTNRDGKMDVLVVDPQGATSYIMLGNGAGAFSFSQHVSTGNGVSELADVNGDGIPDLLLTTGPLVQLGKGDGTFGPLLSSGVQARGCAYADVDGDGHLDAVCANALSKGTGLYVLHGNNDGTFNPAPVSFTAYPDGPTGVAGSAVLSAVVQVQDRNGDGIADVLGISGDGWTNIIGHAGFAFDSPVHFAAGYVPEQDIYSRLYPQYQSVDLDGDGRPDLVTAGPNGVYITSSKAPSLQQPPAATPVSEIGYTVGYAAVADFDGDGIPDVSASGSKNLTFSRGNGDGTFQQLRSLANADINFSTPTSASQAKLLAGDFDGDGKQDLIAIGSPSIYSYNPYFLRGLGDGDFAVPVLLALPADSLYAGANRPVVDINGDGKDDLLTISTSSSLSSTPQILFALSTGNGTFRTVSTNVLTEPMDSTFQRQISFPALADFNGDGKLDAVYGVIDNVYVVAGNGDGTFKAGNTLKIPIPKVVDLKTTATSAVTTGDFDGDGFTDFALLTFHGDAGNTASTASLSALTIYYGKGDGTFAAPLQQTFRRIFTDVLGLDVDNDGRVDLVLNNGNTFDLKAVAILHGSKDRQLGDETDYYAGSGLSSMIASDLNRDGFTDLLFANGDYNISANSVTPLINLGGGSLLTGSVLADPEPSAPGQPFDVIAKLTATAGEELSGLVTLKVDGISIGSVPLVGNVARISGPVDLAQGRHTLTAAWQGDATHAAFALTGSHTVSALLHKSTIALSADPISTFVGQATTLTAIVTDLMSDPAFPPTGDVTFTDGGMLLGTSHLGADGHVRPSVQWTASGLHTITVSYAGDITHGGATASTTVQVLPAVPFVSIMVSPNPAYQGQTVTIVAQVANPTNMLGLPELTGAVRFLDGTNLLGEVDLSSNKATFQTTSLAVGQHPLTALYVGNANYASALSAEVVENVLRSDLLLSSDPTSLVLQTQHHATFMLKATSVGAFADTLTFSVRDLPAHASLRYGSSTVRLAAGESVTTSVSFDTSDVIGYLSEAHSRSQRVSLACMLVGALTLPLGFLFAGKSSRATGPVLLLALALISMSAIGCSGKYPSSVEPGKYVLHLIVRGSNTEITRTLDMPLTVTP